MSVLVRQIKKKKTLCCILAILKEFIFQRIFKKKDNIFFIFSATTHYQILKFFCDYNWALKFFDLQTLWIQEP